MKKVLFFLMMLVAFCLSGTLQAQDIVTIGTGTSAGYYPIPGFYGWQYDVYIYSPTEAQDLMDDLDVTSIAYDLTSISSTSGAQMTIWMKDVDLNFTLSTSQTFAQLTAGATQVYNNTSFSTASTGWNTFQLSQPFTHEGGKALLVAVRGTGCTTSGGCSRQCHYTSVTGTHWYKHADSSDPGTSATGTLDGSRANIQLEVYPIGGNTCASPTGLTVTNITSDGATLMWSSNSTATSWEVYITTSATDIPDSTTIPTDYASDTTYTAMNLNSSTMYYFYVRANCGPGEVSRWRAVSFQTLCEALTTLPMFENFDSHTGSTSGTSNNLPDCWNYLNTGTYSTYAGYPIIYNSTSYSESGNNSLRFYTYTSTTTMGDQYAILPRIDVTYNPIDNLQVTMDVRKYSTSYANFTLIVGVMSDPTDVTTFVPVDTIVQSETTYNEYTVMFNNYTGIGEYIAMYAPKVTPSNLSYNAGHVDNLVLEPIPSCLKPTGVTLSNVTATSVDVSWTPGDAEFAWEIVVVPTGTPVTSGLAEYATIYPYTVSNLDDDTQYDLYVRADCGGGDYSSWTQPQSFTTDPLCTPPSNLTISQIAGTSALVSWSPAFVGATNYTVEYSEAGMDMWTPEVVNGTSYMIPFLNPQTSYDVRVYSNCDLSSADTLTRTFSTGCLSGGDMNIGDGTNTSTSIPSYSFYKHGYSQQIFTASELGGANTFNSISFYMVNLSQQRNYKIYLMHTTATTSSDWLPTTNAQLVYSGPQTLVADSWNTFNFSTPFAYNGVDNLAVIVIDSNSSYSSGNSWRVHNAPAGTGATKYTYNDDTAYSITSAPTTTNGGTLAVRNNVIFGGDCDSLSTCVRPNLYIASKTDESITIDWAPGYMESSWDLEYSTDDTTWVSLGSLTSAPYTLDNLNANTVYYIRIRSNCGSDYSDWVKIHERTECGYVNIPLMEGFESAPGSGSGNMITCWSTNSNYTSTHYPYTSSSQHHNGTYSVYFYAGSSYYSYLITPRFDDNVMMNNLEVSFWAYKTSSTYYIQVGVMSNPEDPSTFVQIGQFSPSATSVWELFEVTTASYTGDGHYIAFRLPSDISNYMYIDDINIDAIPTCQHVTNIHVDGTTLTGVSADILWTPGGTESEWEYVVAPANTVTNPENELSNTVYTAVAPLTGLVANTSYDIFVRANCAPGDNSRWEMYTFRTACDAITALPFVDNFDSYGVGSGVWIPCWKKFSTYTLSTTLPYVSGTSWGGTTGADGSVGYLYFYTATSGTYTMAVTPSFDPSIPINTLRAKFKYKRHNSNDEVIVGVISDITDSTTFVPVDTITVSTTDTWTDTHVDFSSYTGTGTYIAFMCMYHNNNTYSMIDNLSINTLPNCLEPNGFMVSSLDETSVSLTWNAGNENEWELYVVPAGSTLENVTPITLYDTSYTVTGLNSNTSYDAYLRAVCAGSGYSDYSITYFTTTCAAMDSLPFVENFDSHTGTTSTSASTSNLPSCWNNISGSYSSYAGYPIIYNSSSSAASGSNSMRFYVGTTTSYDYGDEYAILPPIDQTLYPINTLQLTMDVRKGSASYTDFTLIVGVMSNPSDANTFVPVDTIVRTEATYDEYTVFFSNYTGTGNFIALCAPKNTQNNVAYNTGYVDNIVVDVIPSCPRPNDLTVTGITSNTIDLSWTDYSSGAASSWTVEYGTPGFTPGTYAGTILQANTNSITLPNLTANTSYEIYVMADCGMGDQSTWSNPLVVTTSCDLLTTLPFTENFDSYTAYTSTSASTSNLPNCWNNLSGSYSSYAGYPIIYYSSSTNYASSAPNAMRFYSGTTTSYDYGDEYAILPPVDQTLYPINTLQLTIDVRKGSTSYADFTLFVGVMTNPQDASTFVAVDTIVQPNATYSEYTVYFTNYTGSGNFIALKAPRHTPTNVSYNTGYVDNIYLEEIPSCPRPNGLHVDAVTNSSITLSWNEIGSANSWEIEYGAPGFTLGSGTTVQATSNPMTVTGLPSSSNYEFYVRSVCSATDMSNWSNPCVGATECDVTNVPYTEDFESYTGTTYSDNNGPVPLCWTNYGINTSYGHPHVIGSGNYHYTHSGNNCLVFTAGTSGNGTDAYAMMPSFSQALNTLEVSFYYAMESTSYGTLYVGYVTNTADPDNTFVMLETVTSIDGDDSPMDSITVDLSSYPSVPANGNICFHWNVNGSWYNCCIDDIAVNVAGSGPIVQPCEVPQGLTVANVDNTTATLTWTPNANVQYWTIDYKKTSANTWTTVNNITSPTYTLTNLNQITQYDVRLAAVCGDNNTSDYTPVVQFTTTNVGVNDYDMSTTLYPNPTTGEIRIQNTEFRIQSVEVYDVYGKLIKSVKVDDFSVVIDLSANASGVYFTRIMTDNGMVTKRVVKE
jgi:hypothetical protein